MNIIKFDKNKINIQEKLKKLFNSNILEDCHLKYTKDNKREIFNKFNDNTTEYHNMFNKNKSLFEEDYENIVKHIKNTKYKNEEFIVYQTFPALRVSIPGNLSVGEMHVDADYNHPKEEMNYWMPLTKLNETNTVWHESEPNKGDFKPLIINYGEIAEVYFNKCRHFSKINTTNKTRFSLDFRIIPGSKWHLVDNNNSSMFHKVKFVIGKYYKKM